ncbi:Rad24 protein [Saccharomycopsis crataegensis]|uniref:Rad24 protein n=1 Tax=Saccharomycopsis crataegensis TaxID=43959 RepID=A0AAV5QY83_9ASCO|nr:Rad24 protein [Saccharomycopsis crataegensis]
MKYISLDSDEGDSIIDDSLIEETGSVPPVNHPKKHSKTIKRTRSINLSELASHIGTTEKKPRHEKILSSSSKLSANLSIKSVSPSPSSSSSSPPSSSSSSSPSSSWVDKYSPTSINDIAVHPRKIKEVRTKLTSMLYHDYPPRLLILTGPSGSGKSTMVKLLSQELLSKPVLEWINPSTIKNTSHVDAFSEFLKAAKYCQGQNLSIILVEDLPFIFHEPTKDAFQAAVYQWLHYDPLTTLPPLVICLTEENFENDKNNNNFASWDITNNFSVDTVFGHKVLQSHGKYQQIKFNPVNATLMTKTLKRIVNDNSQLFNHHQLKSYLPKLVASGDIRSAILSLQCWGSWRSKAHQLPGVTDSMYLVFGKDVSFDLFHIIGKIIYGSQKVQPADLLRYSEEIPGNRQSPPDKKNCFNGLYLKKSSSDNSLSLKSSPTDQPYNIKLATNYVLCNTILASNTLDLRLLSLLILENYAIYNCSHYKLSKASKILKILSLVDTFPKWQVDLEVATDLVVRGTRISLEQDISKNQVMYLDNLGKWSLINGEKLLKNEESLRNDDKKFPLKSQGQFVNPHQKSSTSNHRSSNHHDKLGFPRDFKLMKKSRHTKDAVNFHRYQKSQTSSSTIGILSFNDTNLYHGYYEAVINQQKQFKGKSYGYIAQQFKDKNYAGHPPSRLQNKIDELSQWSTQKNLLIKRLGGEINSNGGDQAGGTVSTMMGDLGRNNIAEYYKNYEIYQGNFGEENDYSEGELEDDPIDDDGDDDNVGGGDNWSDGEMMSDSDLDNF